MKKLLAWIGRLLTSDQRHTRSRGRHRCRLGLERLEDRMVPSGTLGSLIFNEDFNQPVGSLPNTSTWHYNMGSDPNNTAVRYVNDSSTLSVVNDVNASDGKSLGMTIYPTSAGNWTFNSARINTANRPGGHIQYGLIEARIKLPGGPNGQGDGLWPAFWMLGANHKQGVPWPNCGEIDIMEQGLPGPGTNVGSTHFGSETGPTRKDTAATYTLPGGQSFYSSYHTFAVYWTPGSITFSVDGNPYSTVERSSYSSALWDQTFHQPFYMILNICDGGPNNASGFGGPVTKNSTFPQTMYVDYVRAYSLIGITTPTNFTAVPTSTNAVNLSWQHPANDETGFVLQRSKTADFGTIDATINLPQGSTSYQDVTGSPATTYYYRLQAVASDGAHNYQSGYANATVTTRVASPDLALYRPVFASSLENNSFSAASAVDGNSATRWSSQFSDPQWVYVDLGGTFNITGVTLNWETAAGKNYQIQVSADAANWTTIATTTGNTRAGVHDYMALSATGRYVRIYGTARATPYGYSLYDFNVYGVAAPVPTGTTSFVITNQTGQPVNFAMYGIDNATGQWSYFNGTASGSNNFSGSFVAAQQLGAGQLLPTYRFTGSSALLNLPNTSAGITSAAMVLTVGDRAPSITVASNFSLPRPAPSNPTLVNATTNPYYDFVEFTLDSNKTLYINTTQVDQLGFPITLGSSPQAAGSPVGVTPGITREAIFQAFATFLAQETDPSARDFLPLVQNASAGGPYRIIAPGQYLAMSGKASDPLNHYFDSVLASFFAAPPALKLTALNPHNNGDPASYTFVGTATTHNPVGSGDLVNGAPATNPNDNRNFAVIDFVGQPGSGSLTGVHFYVYSPISPPSWVGARGAGEQVFANNGVFADNVTRFGNGLKSIILGNLENQVVSALTRGIAGIATPSTYSNTTAFWTDPAQAFPAGAKANLYAKFLHTGTIGGENIFIGGRAYAFPYSDQGDQAPFFAIQNPNSISITLGPWGSTQVGPTITSAAAATSAAVGSLYRYVFTATGTPTPTLSASGLPGWLTFNPGTGVLSGTPTAAQAGTSATVTLTASNGIAPDARMIFTIAVPAQTTPFASTLYLRSAGALAAQPGTTAQADTIASASGINHDGAPTKALVYQINGLTAAYDPTKQTQFTLFLDAGTQVANGTQLRVSYDFAGDGTYDRVETYRYFAEDNRLGWETYTQGVGLRSSTGAFANLTNGSVKVEVWNAIGQAPVLLRVNANASDGLQSRIAIPFADSTPNATPTLFVSPTALALGTTTAGTAGSARTFVVSGSHLTANLVINAPTGVHVSSDGATYSSSLNLVPDATGTVATTTIHVRIAASATVGAINGNITITSAGAAQQNVGVTGTINPPTTPVSNTMYLLRAGAAGSAGTLGSLPGTGAQVDTIASAGGKNHDGAPTNALVFQTNGLTGSYDPTKQTQFTLFVDAGRQIANGTQIRISYDFNGDGTYDRVETYRYFAEDNVPGWEKYTQGVGVLSGIGSFANLNNGSIRMEVWNAIGTNSVSLRTNATNIEGEQSLITLPFVNLTRSN